ncbi:type II toxin-antitoxin system VapC family toxin [Glycomyces albidus]|uniref:PIN domain-containing protein n=1 Tax=Glycomyces albidus TaxID=2656774 RepID=A0A6L5G6H9_9ACTN|nr:PIN domain-containing protein [Glycomyces albidus]MQM25254.1 PIN domain-containing protein [Glycomyces albidus]
MTLPDNPDTVCFDANLYINFLNGAGPHLIVESLLRHAEAGRLEIHVPTLCFLEVRGWPSGAYDDDRDREALSLITRPYCIPVEFNLAVGRIGRDLLSKYPQLKNFDAGQIASAAYAHSDVFLTSDRQLLSIGKYEGVQIAEPYLPAGLPPLIIQDQLDGL